MERPLEQSLFVRIVVYWISLKNTGLSSCMTLGMDRKGMELELPLLTVDSTVKRALADGSLSFISLSLYSL